MIYAIFLCYQMTGLCQPAPGFNAQVYTVQSECQRVVASIPGNRPGIPTQGIDWRCMGREVSAWR